MTESSNDPVFGNMNRLLHLTRDEDERGLVLSVAAFSEDCLGRMLSTYMRGGKVATELVEGFNAPLGTFSARIKAGLALGLLSDEQHRNLEVARRIRNEFAHNWEGCSLSNQNIKDWIATMSDSRIHPDPPRTPLDKFRNSMHNTLVELQLVLNSLGESKMQLPFVGMHISLNKPEA